MANRIDQGRQQEYPNHDAPAIDQHAATPFAQIVSRGLKDEPLVPKEGNCDVQQAGQDAGKNVSVWHVRREKRGENRVRRISERGIPHTYKQVTTELSRRYVSRELFEGAGLLKSFEHRFYSPKSSASTISARMCPVRM